MIRVESVTKRYDGLKAVDNVSYTVEPGEVFALLGPNGAGKTTLVRMLMGFARPTCGRLLIDGVPVSDPACRKKVGYLAEGHRIPPFLTGYEYLMRHAGLCGMARVDAVKEVGSMLEKVGMADKGRQRAGTYSKGMSRRVGLAAALIGNPRLLILDEPVSGLDPLGIRDVRTLLEQLQNQGTTIVLNSHLLSEVERVCSTAAIMTGGRIRVKDRIDNIVTKGESLEDVFVRYVEEGASA